VTKRVIALRPKRQQWTLFAARPAQINQRTMTAPGRPRRLAVAVLNQRIPQAARYCGPEAQMPGASALWEDFPEHIAARPDPDG
jgi:hypothetical protein